MALDSDLSDFAFSLANFSVLFFLLRILLHNYNYVNSKRNVDSEKFKPHIGFEPTTLRDLVKCSNH